ncbi:MAG: hypothetical protein GF398_07880 [Chitinivibrionales bacterium]|nr:hypothetical protein [Chitinivibrionales bacterium]
MNGIDFHGSMHNLTQMDKHQQDGSKMPVVHQNQNAQAAEQEALKRLDMPLEPDESEGKDINPDENRRNPNYQKQKKKKKKKERKNPRSGMTGSGRFVDVDA